MRLFCQGGFDRFGFGGDGRMESVCRKVMFLLLSGTWLLVGGCSGLSGTWTREIPIAQETSIPLQFITFDENFGFTATFEDDLNLRTSTGTYTWNGFRLRMTFPGESEPTYGGRRGTKGRLIVVALKDNNARGAAFVRVER